MTYFMTLYVDGGCRHRPASDTYGAAIVIFKGRHGKALSRWALDLPTKEADLPVTNQRAKLSAIISAQLLALQQSLELSNDPSIHIKIYSDSREAISCIKERISRWRYNGWQNSRGEPVVNRDLLQQIDFLNTHLKALGEVKYIWISKFENQEANDVCNRYIDNM
ncbi:hypothetical protein EYC80_009856 [Monilinia laxa]|uniref:ribonuclease H n=1 Tax=Monilinia laxa TaxID=61186 RepID=A0A5N6JTR7_MONLA|nr:hypothetical protein EYC80_009856 [Monilinia laxa]